MPVGALALLRNEEARTKCATPFVVTRNGRGEFYRLAGIRRRGIDPRDEGYWFPAVELGQGLIVTDMPSRFRLQRAADDCGLHKLKLTDHAGARVYWEGWCPRSERELELAFVKLDGDVIVQPGAAAGAVDLVPRGLNGIFWGLAAAIAVIGGAAVATGLAIVAALR